jgi:hypothetical protein
LRQHALAASQVDDCGVVGLRVYGRKSGSNRTDYEKQEAEKYRAQLSA